MKKDGITKIFRIVAIIIIVGFFAANTVQTGTENEETIIHKPIGPGLASEWKTYYNERWAYSIKYPSDWTARVTLENIGKPEYVIQEEVTFAKPGYGQITLNVWINQSKLSLWQWFEKNRHWFMGGEAEITRCTATELALQAICAREPQTHQAYEVLKCFFQKNNHVYQLMYNNSDDSRSKPIYGYMLAYFKFEES